MPQVNVEFDEDTVRSLDRIAAKQSIRRPELLRRTVRELIDAESDGRELFSAPLQEIRAEDLAHLAREQGAAGRELSRLRASTDRREKQLQAAMAQLADAHAAFERDVLAARERAERKFREQLDGELAPFRAEIAALKNELKAAQLDNPRLDAMEAELKRLVASPRTQRNLVLGDDRMLSFRFLAQLGGLLLLIGGVMALCLTALIPSWGLFVANRSLDGDPGMCRLIEYRYGRPDCQVPALHRIDRTPPRSTPAAGAKRR